MGGPRQNSTDIKPPPPPPPGMHIREYFRVCLRNYGPPFTDVWVSPLKKLLWEPTPEPPNVRLQL